jgi:alpha-tubulin suppressor-like RCC1 family protein
MIGRRPLTAVEAISAGGAVTCARQQGGALYCWGDNRFGQLGNGGVGNDQCRPTTEFACSWHPTAVTGVNDAVQVSCGERNVCALRSSNRIWCAGDASDGLLGSDLGTPSPVLIEVDSSPATSATSVKVGASHACAVLATTNLIACWGRNTRGEVYVPTATAALLTEPTPVDPGLASDVVQVVAGDAFACHLTADGFAYCVGDNSSGEVGSGNAPDSVEHPVPDLVNGLP